MEDIKTIIRALRCSMKPWEIFEERGCESCPYVLDEQQPYGWESCNVGRIVLDGAEALERLYEQVNSRGFDPVRIGASMEAARLRAGLGVEELASKAYIGRNTMYTMERNSRGSLDGMAAAAKALGITIEQYIGRYRDRIYPAGKELEWKLGSLRERNLSCLRSGKEMTVSRAVLYSFFRGRNVTIKSALAISDYLECSLDDMA